MAKGEVFLESISFTDVDPVYENSLSMGRMLFDVGTRVIKWSEPGGLSQYKTAAHVTKAHDRKTGRTKTRTIKGRRYRKRKGGMDGVTQLFIHHTGGDGDGAGRVYNTLHNERDLSVHFVVDDTGVVWQFLDVEECAWHGGSHNDISVGFECCLYPLAERNPGYYSPKRLRIYNNLPHEVAKEEIHGQSYEVFKFTNPQVEALARLCAGIWVVLGHRKATSAPRVGDATREPLGRPPVFPRGRNGEIPRTVVSSPKKHVGLIGHLQTTRRKVDPMGFPWEDFENRVRILCFEFLKNADGHL